MRTTVPLVVHCQQKARDIIARMRQLKENMDVEREKEEQLRRSKFTFVEQGHVAKKMRLGKTAKAMCVTKKDLMLVGRRSAKASSSQDNEVAL